MVCAGGRARPARAASAHAGAACRRTLAQPTPPARWQSPHPPGPLTSWRLQYMGPATYVQVKGLRPGRWYAVRVECQPVVSDTSVVLELAQPSPVLLVATPPTLPEAPAAPGLASRARNTLKVGGGRGGKTSCRGRPAAGLPAGPGLLSLLHLLLPAAGLQWQRARGEGRLSRAGAGRGMCAWPAALLTAAPRPSPSAVQVAGAGRDGGAGHPALRAGDGAAPAGLGGPAQCRGVGGSASVCVGVQLCLKHSGQPQT